MRPPDCPRHRRLVLDLALGRLDGARAVAAEAARIGCPICGAWWSECFAGTEARLVDDAVEKAFVEFHAPSGTARRALVAVAAILVLAAGLGLLWLVQRSAPSTLRPTPGEVVERLYGGDTAATTDLTGDGRVDAGDLAAALRASRVGR
jgi:hypothetical protein